MVTEELLNSYQKAKYIAFIDNEMVRLKVGVSCPTIDVLMLKHSAKSAYFITPENPFSQNLSIEENTLRHKRFITDLNDGNFAFYEGYGTDEEETWSKEKSYLVVCDDKHQMNELAARYGQNAFLEIAKHQPVKLLVLEAMTYLPAN